MKRITLAGRSLLAASIVVALLIPAAALAGPGQANGPASKTPPTPPAAVSTTRPSTTGKPAATGQPAGSTANPQGQPADNLARRIANVLAARKRRFDAASAAITAHVARVSAVADKVETSGGDVSKARAYLTEATDAVATANALEQQTADELKAIPGSGNPKAALAAARASGSKAVAELKLARTKVVMAIHELRAVVKAMEKPSETSESP